MPLDDLDDFLAMELGTPTKSHKVAKQVDSLEALVLSRVQEVCPPEERLSQLDNKTTQVQLSETETEPLYQFLEILWPVLNTLQELLANDNPEIDKQQLSQQRSQLAEKLLALPEIKGLDKAGIFAAIAACMDAISSTKIETRISALNRIKNLYQTLIAINKEVKEQKLKAAENFLDQLL